MTSKTPEELEADIAVQREQLADTVDALSAKLDVKAQAKAKVDEKKEQAREAVSDAQAKIADAPAQAKENPKPVAAIVGGTLAFVAVVVLWRRRRS